MTAPDETRLLAALEATWPPAAIDETSAPGWRLRDGAGAGKRVDSARSLGSSDFEAAAGFVDICRTTPNDYVLFRPLEAYLHELHGHVLEVSAVDLQLSAGSSANGLAELP